MFVARLVLFLSFCCAVAFGQVPQEDIAFAYEAYALASQWAGRGQVPEGSLAVPAANVVAVHATIRKAGMTLGQSTAAVEDAELAADLDRPAAKAVDVMPLVRRAVEAAVHEALLNEDSPSSKTDEQQEGPGFVLDLQFARPLRPLKIKALADLPGLVRLGLDGLAMRQDQQWAWVFPGSAIAANTDLNAQLSRLLAALKLPLDSKARIGGDQGPRLYRFEVVHLVQPSDSQQPILLRRGQEWLSTQPLDGQMLTLIGEQMADYLQQRQREDGSFAGTYEPTADRYSPVTADAAEAALAVYALARASRLSSADRPLRAEAAQRGLKNLLSLAATREPGVPGSDAAATALTLLALLETPAASQWKEPRDDLAAALLKMQQPDGAMRLSAKVQSPLAGLSTQAVGAYALVRLFDQTRQPDHRRRALSAMQGVWKKIGDHPSEAFRAMPWAAMAERDLIRLTSEPSQPQAMMNLCDQLWKAQITLWGDDPDRSGDTVGGFNVGEGLYRPTWLSSLPLAGLAVVAADRTLIAPDKRAHWIISCALGARFLSQLTVQSSGAYYMRNPREAIGGVRSALWDNRQPLAATAASLLALVELRHTLATLAEEK